MEKLARRTAETIAKALNYDDDKKAVIAYGLTALYQMTIIGLFVLVIGLVFGFFEEATIIFFGVGLLRKSTGGAHAKSMLGCTVISILSISLMSAFCRYLLITIDPINLLIPVCVFLISWCYYIAYDKVPVDSPNKPIKSPEKIKRLRKQSFIIISVYSILCITLIVFSSYNKRMISLSGALICSLVWQMLTLTRWGERFINLLDSPFNKDK